MRASIDSFIRRKLFSSAALFMSSDGVSIESTGSYGRAGFRVDTLSFLRE